MALRLLVSTKMEDISTGDVTSMSYNYVGERAVTTTTDATITVRDLDDSGAWTVKDGGEIKGAHAGVIWKAAWAHPRFGQILATCCQDGTIKIWEELDGALAEAEGGSCWFTQATISADRAVYDIRFAPVHLGLKMAAALGDGTVRIYDCTDPRTHTQWPQQEVLGDREGGVTCLDWLPSEFEKQPMMVVGTSLGRVQIWRHDASDKRWQRTVQLPHHNTHPVIDVTWAPWMGGKHHRIASCGMDGRVQIHLLGKRGAAYAEVGGEWDHERSTDLRDSEQQVLPIAAVSCESSSLRVKQMTHPPHLKQLYSSPDSKHVQHGHFRGTKNYVQAKAQRVAWHETRAMLTSCGPDNIVRVWRPVSDGEWTCVDRLGDLSVGIGTGSLGPDGSVFHPQSVAYVVEDR